MDRAAGIAARTVKNSAHYNQPRPMTKDDLVKLAIDAGMLAYGAGQKELSAQMMEIALELDPENAIAANGVAWDLAVRGKDLDRAMKLVDIALKKDPNSAAFMDTRGWIYYQMGDYQEALKWLEAAVKRDPNHPELRHNLARAHWASGYIQGAYVEARKALLLNPGYTEAQKLMREIRRTYNPRRRPLEKTDILTGFDHTETPVNQVQHLLMVLG
jgi:Putative Zn-dependent protease, contains TPR repeats